MDNSSSSAAARFSANHYAGNEAVLRDLLTHHLHKSVKASATATRSTFLPSSIFSLCAPSGLEDSDSTWNMMAQVLEPVLVRRSEAPIWLNTPRPLMQSATKASGLSELLHSGVLEQGRRTQDAGCDRYYDPARLLALPAQFHDAPGILSLDDDDLNAILDACVNWKTRRGYARLPPRAIFRGRTYNPSADDCNPGSDVPRRILFGQPLRMLSDLRAGWMSSPRWWSSQGVTRAAGAASKGTGGESKSSSHSQP